MGNSNEMEENNMIAVRIEEGVIVERVSTSALPENFEVDTKGFSYVGAKRVEFDADWNVKPLSALVAEGVVEVPVGQKLEGDEFVSMTEVELVKAGIHALPNDEKIVDGAIVKKTMLEQYEDCSITADVYNAYIVECRKAAYANETDALFWDYQEGTITKEDWLSAKATIKAKYEKVTV